MHGNIGGRACPTVRLSVETEHRGDGAGRYQESHSSYAGQDNPKHKHAAAPRVWLLLVRHRIATVVRRVILVYNRAAVVSDSTAPT